MNEQLSGLSSLIRDTAEAHHAAEKRLPPHDWQDWYAAFMIARQSGHTFSAASLADAAVLCLLRSTRP